jgi:predicted MFS family arabinose efflux permease
MERQVGKSTLILLLGLAGFMVMADNWVVSPILPAIAASLGINIPTAGLLITAYMIPFGIFQIIFGPLADRYGKKQVITLSMVLFTVATGLCAFGSGLASVAIFRALTGVFAASVMPISFALIGDSFPMQERQQALGTFIGISFLGQGLSMAMGGTISYFFDWHGVFLVYAVLSLVPTVLLLKNYRMIPSQKNPDSSIIKPYLELLSNPASLFTYLAIVLEGTFIIGSFSYGGSYLSRIHHYNSLQIGLLMTGFGIMSVIGGRVSGKLANRIRALKVLWIGLLLAAAGDLVIYFQGANIGVFIVGIATLGLGFIFAHSTLVTRATGFAQKSRGTAMSLVACCFMGSGGVGTAIGGKLIAGHGIASVFGIYGSGLVVALMVVLLLLRDDSPATARISSNIELIVSENA